MARVSEDEVLLLWRALRAFRSGKRPDCAPRGKPAVSGCPLYPVCPRWHGQPDDAAASLNETFGQTQQRQSSWPCSRLLELLAPDLTTIGGRRHA